MMNELSVYSGETRDGASVEKSAETLWIFLRVLLVTFAFALAISWLNIPDPFIRHDDYPTVFGEEESYYWKTLSEGRWLNYWYIAKPFVLPPQVSFLIYLAAWSIFASAFAVHAFDAGTRPFLGARYMLAALIVLTPQAFDIAQWFNTVAFGICIIAVYGLVCLFASRKAAIWALLVFVPLSFSAYNTYPFYLLAMLLCRVDLDRSVRDLARVLIVFCVAFVMAILVTNTLNWHFHGVFGIEEAEWRSPNHLESLNDVAENLAVIHAFWVEVFIIYGMGYLLVGYAVFAIPLLFVLAVLRKSRGLVLYGMVTPILGMGLLTFYTLTTGVYVPVRATVFMWLVSCFFLIAGIDAVSTTRSRRLILSIGVLACISFFAKEFILRFSYLQIWQTTTKEFAARIPGDSDRVVIYGPIAMFEGARNAAIQSPDGLSYRLRYLTGKPVVTCKFGEDECADETPPFEPRTRFGSMILETEGKVTYIRLPALDAAP